MSYSILIVEDELALLNILSAYFTNDGFEVHLAEDGLHALQIFKNNKIDIVCCDVMMPNIDGWQVAKSIRQQSNIPIVFMTALSSEEDQLKGYNLDIDDYITKPFSPTILVAKVKRLLSRLSQLEDTSSKSAVFTYEEMKVDFSSRTCYVSQQEVHLSKTEFDLLEFLIKNHNIAIDRVTILDEVWGMDVYVEERVVDTNIKVLRKKLGHYGTLIKTVFGIGYKFYVE